MFGRWNNSKKSPPRPADCRRPADVDPAVPVEVVKRRPPEHLAESVERLDRALASLGAFTTERAVPTSVVINPLLVVWDAAHEVGAEVSGPVEALLTAAVQRTTLGPDELVSCSDEVRALALQETVLSELVHG